MNAPSEGLPISKRDKSNEKKLLDEESFRDFVFVYPSMLHAKMNPNFFKGTVVEVEVAHELANQSN